MNYIYKKTNSSVVTEILYDGAWQRLYLVLVHDRLYCYHDVPEQIVLDMIEAPSIGRYFNANIVRYRCDALESEDPDYIQAMSAAIVEGAVTSDNAAKQLDRENIVSAGRDVEKEPTDTAANPSEPAGMPFFFGPLVDSVDCPTFVKQAQSIFREVVTDYKCPVDKASRIAEESHRALAPFLPIATVNHINQILKELNVVVTVVNPRKSKVGDCRLDRTHHIAYITINENINRYKFLCVLLHELSHALNHLQFSAHDEVWKSIYTCLLADCYLLFPKKYRQELQWMMVHSPATTRSTNFYGRGILSGCSCDSPACFFADSIDSEAERKDYAGIVQDYALHAVMTNTRLFLEDDDECLLSQCAGKLARAMIESTIEERDVVSAAEKKVKTQLQCGDLTRSENLMRAVKRLSDMLVRCWTLYNPLSPAHVNCFTYNYRGGNPWIDELIALVLVK